jgi:hypothetical protein
MSVPVFLKIMAAQDPSVKSTLDEIARAAERTLAANPIEFFPSGTLERTKLAERLLEDMRVKSSQVAGELVVLRDRLNSVANTPGLGDQSREYAEIVARMKALEAASKDIIQLNPQIEATFKSLTSSAEEGLRRVAERSRNLADMGQIITGAFAGVGSIFSGLAAGALAVAANFESLKAKLVSVTGSVTEANRVFEFTRGFAAITPFDVEGLVASATVIRGFQQDIESLLPVAANLAAAMGVDLNQATLALSKAAAGSPEGFQSLRDTMGITANEVQRFGGVIDKATGQLSILPANVEANRNALIRLINTKYGDAIARQSDTLAGAVSNVGDAVKSTAANFGQALLPVATTGARLFAGLVGVLDSIPGPMKAIAVVSAAIVGGLGLVGAAVAGTVTGLLLLQAQLIEIAAARAPGAAASLNLVTGALTRVTGAAVGARTTLAALAVNPLAIFLTGVATAGGIAYLALNQYQRSMVAAGKATAEASRDFAATNVSLRQGIAILNDAQRETGKTVGFVRDATLQIAQIKAAFEDLTPEQFIDAMDRAGATIEGFKNQLGATEGKVKAQKELLAQLNEQLKELESRRIKIDGETGLMSIDPVVITLIEEVTGKIKALEFILGRGEADVVFLKGAIAEAEELKNRLSPLIAESQNLGKILDLSKQSGSVATLNIALADVNQQIVKNSNDAAIGSANLDVLIGKLRAIQNRGPDFDLQRKALQEQINLVRDRQAITETIADREKAAAKEVSDAAELDFRRRKALGQTNLQDELSFIQQRLTFAKQGSEEEIRLLEQSAQVKKQILDQEKSDREKALQELIEVARSAQSAADQGLQDAKSQADAKLSEINAATQDALANAANSTSKLTAIESGIAAIQKARRDGLLDEVEAQKQVNDLTRQKLQIEQQVAQEKARQQIETGNIQLQGLQQEQQILEARKALGENVEQEITENRRQQLQARLALLEQERQAAIQAAQGQADSIAIINQQFDLKQQQVLSGEALRKLQEQAKTEKGITDSLGRIEQKTRQTFSRLGGANSPLQSLEEAFSGFALGNFSLDSPIKKTIKPPTFNTGRLEQLKTEIVKDSRPGEIGRYTNDINQAARDSQQARRGLGGGSPLAGNIQNYNVSINGTQVSASDPRFFSAVSDVMDHHARAAKLRGPRGVG